MIPFDTMVLFVGVAFALAMAPGPDNIFVLMQSAMHGRVQGLWVTLGLASGLVVHTTAVAFGVAVLIETSQTAFAVLKYAGVGYLLYLAWGAARSSGAALEDKGTESLSAKRLYLRGFIMNVVNPKVTIFFLAFLTQFVDPAVGPVVPQFYQLGALMMAVTIVTFGTVALAAGALGEWLRQSPRAMMWLDRVAAGVFVGLAVKLALTEK